MVNTCPATSHSQIATAPLRTRAGAATIWPKLKEVAEAVESVMGLNWAAAVRSVDVLLDGQIRRQAWSSPGSHRRCPRSPRICRSGPARQRKFIGVVVTIAFVIVYALVAMALAQARFVQGAPDLLQWIYYAVIGMAWVLPVMPLIRWMERPDSGFDADR